MCHFAHLLDIGRFFSKKRATAGHLEDAQESVEFHYVARFWIKSRFFDIWAIYSIFSIYRAKTRIRLRRRAIMPVAPK